MRAVFEPAIGRALRIAPEEGDRTALEAGISRAGGEETGTPSAEVPEAMTDPGLMPAAAAVLQAWVHVAADSGVELAVVAGVEGRRNVAKEISEEREYEITIC